MARPGQFSLFGFPVHVRSGFLLFAILVIAINPMPFGAWLAVFVAVFTLIHELGHAFAARATGAKAEIALDLFYGYAAFVPTRPLKGWERAGISFAGPATQLLTSVAALAAMGVNPLDRHSFTRDDVTMALWWAGPMIALFNLIPVLPFDGGHIVLVGLQKLFGTRARRIMVVASVVLTAAGVILLALSERYRSMAVFAALPLITQLQMLQQTKPTATDNPAVPASPAEQMSRLAAGEQRAWTDDDTTAMLDGQVPSPWFVAHRHLRAGQAGLAGDVLLADFAAGREPAWWPPDAAPERDLEALVNLLPRPLPTGSPYAEYVLSGVLLRLGEYSEAAHYAAAAYARRPAPSLAVNVARAAAALGDRPTALAWLRTARASTANVATLQATIDQADEFDRLRDDADFAQVLR